MGVWGYDPTKICRRSEYVSHPNIHIFFIQNCCWINLQASHHQGWKTCVKVEGKSNLSSRLKQSDGLTLLTPTTLFFDRSTPLDLPDLEDCWCKVVLVGCRSCRYCHQPTVSKYWRTGSTGVSVPSSQALEDILKFEYHCDIISQHSKHCSL